MKKTKKFLSILLSLLMIISAMPFSAVTALANDDFVISEDGVLVAYNGAGGDVVIPNGISKIGDRAFYDCKNLDSIYIPDSVTSIGSEIFSYDLRRLYVKHSCRNNIADIIRFDHQYIIIDDNDIHKPVNGFCSKCGASEFEIDEDGILTGYNGAGGEVVIPVGVKEINNNVFEMNKAITSVEISNTVTTIGRYAFSACSNLQTVVISKSVTSIEYGAFSGCGALLYFTISDNVSNCEFDMRNLWLKADPLELTIYYYCDSDLDTIKQIIPPIAGGDSNYQVTHDYLDATCIEPRKCSVCNFVSDTSYGEHNWESVSCDTPSKCTICGTFSDGAIGEHNWVEATCTEDGYCSVCHAVGEPAHGHSFTERGERIRNQSCTESELYKVECAYCGLEGEIVEGEPALKHFIHYLLSVEDNVYTYRCLFCEIVYTVDTNALISAIETAENEYINTDIFSKQILNIESLQNSVTNAKNLLASISKELGKNNSDEPLQEDIDNATNAILDAINNLEFKTYSVTVNKIVDDNTVDTETVSVAYGEMFSYFVDLDENQAIYKWVMETDERDVKLNTIAQDFSQVITGDVTFNCYIDNSDTKASDTARVVFYDKTNRVIKLDYVEVGSSVNMSVEAPKVAFYTFTGWEVVSGDPTNVDKSGVSLRATYVPKDIAANKSTIVAIGDIKVNGKQTVTEFYDVKITLTGADSYAYCDENGNILQGINGNVIYAPNNSQTIYVCAGASTKASTSITGYIDENSKLTINAQYYLPSGCTVVEAGVIATNGDKSNTFKSSQQGSSGEYSISLNYGSASGTLNFKSYLTYKDTDGIHTIYSESQAISFGQNA